MLDCHHRVNTSRLRWSPTAQSTGMLFSSWASWAGDWRRRPGMFEHLRFYSNGFPLWCNDSIRFCCMMVSLMTTGQSRVHFQTSFVVFFCNFWATRGFSLVKKNNNTCSLLVKITQNQVTFAFTTWKMTPVQENITSTENLQKHLDVAESGVVPAGYSTAVFWSTINK